MLIGGSPDGRSITSRCVVRQSPGPPSWDGQSGAMLLMLVRLAWLSRLKRREPPSPLRSTSRSSGARARGLYGDVCKHEFDRPLFQSGAAPADWMLRGVRGREPTARLRAAAVAVFVLRGTANLVDNVREIRDASVESAAQSTCRADRVPPRESVPICARRLLGRVRRRLPFERARHRRLLRGRAHSRIREPRRRKPATRPCRSSESRVRGGPRSPRGVSSFLHVDHDGTARSHRRQPPARGLGVVRSASAPDERGAGCRPCSIMCAQSDSA